MPAYISASEKKTPHALYLTVEQVRQAACAWIHAQRLAPGARKAVYQQAAERISYYQHRNQQARRSHTKTTLKRFRAIGIDVDQLPSCKPDDL